MPRYRSFGGLDDPRIDDGDVGFRGVNLRLPSWQLGDGMLSLSENGRIDGHWEPRRGVDIVAAETLENGSPLRLPFFVTDSDTGLAISAASRVDETVTLTVTGHGYDTVTGGAVSATLDPSGANNSIYLEAAEGISSGEYSVEILAPSVRSDIGVSISGNKVTVEPVADARIVVSGSLTDGVDPVVFPDLLPTENERYFSSTGSLDIPESGTWYGVQKSLSGPIWWELLKIVDQVNVAVWESLDDVATPDLATFYPIDSATGVPTLVFYDSSASQVITAINAEGSVASVMTASNAPGSDGTGEIAAVSETFLFGNTLGESAYITVEGLGFTTTDPNGNYLLTPTDANTLTYEIPGATGSETYTIGGGNDIIVARLDDNRSGEILGSCVFSDPNSDNAESVFLAFETTCKVIDLADGSVSELGYPGSDVLTGEVEMLQAFDKVLLFRDGEIAFQWESGDTDFSEVASGTYTQPQIFSVLDSSISSTNGLVTFTVTGNTTIAENDQITVYGSDDDHFADLIGKKFIVTAASSTSITAYMPIPDHAGHGGSTSTQIGKPVSIGGGFIHQPGFPWAVHFQRRLWGPYKWRWDTSLTPDAFSSRGVSDEIVVSDILDSDTYDSIYSQFRITGGTADYIVGLHPFFDDTLLVFNRNSVHSISGTTGSLADTVVRELTREVGCIARKSIATQGNTVFFLSDSGVYGLSFVDQYNLRGMEKPISEAIQPYIDRISWSLADQAVGKYFDNRYWLAVPLDSSPRAGDASGNNAILVFNLLYGQWESVDTFGDPNFLIRDLHVATGETRNDLYAVTTTGGLHILNRADNDFDVIATDPSSSGEQISIAATMETRGYICGTTDRKRFSEFYVQAKGGNSQSDLQFSFTTDDPDGASSDSTASDLLGESIASEDSTDLRGRIGGIRGFNGKLRIERIIGRPQIRSVRVSATMTNRQTISHH